eukprot:COSAG06_NODE_5661_length_3336_cov_1.506024_1_plen_80_part_10
MPSGPLRCGDTQSQRPLLKELQIPRASPPQSFGWGTATLPFVLHGSITQFVESEGMGFQTVAKEGKTGAQEVAVGAATCS